MKRLIHSILKKLGWQLVRRGDAQSSAHRLGAFFPLLKSLGFAPRHILDVGANRGRWTRKALGFFPDAQFTMVEPQDDLKAYVQDLLDAGHRLHWINAGAGDKAGNLMFTIANRDDSSSFVPSSENVGEAGTRQVSVAVRTLNDIVASSGAPVPEMVKIDAEGFDLKVLAGASDLFGKTDIFLVEAVVCATRYENTILEVIRRMGDAGYRMMDITDINRSPKHGLLWLCELAFIRNDSALLREATSYN